MKSNAMHFFRLMQLKMSDIDSVYWKPQNKRNETIQWHGISDALK